MYMDSFHPWHVLHRIVNQPLVSLLEKSNLLVDAINGLVMIVAP